MSANKENMFEVRFYDSRYKKMANRECIICQRDFDVPNHMVNAVTTCCYYCQCVALSLKKIVGFYKLCDVCDKAVWTRPNKIKRKQNRNYCSTKCANIGFSIYSSEKNAGFVKTGRKKYYGGNWLSQRMRARKRDFYECKTCGISEDEYGKELSVHHIVPFVYFETYEEANRLENLKSLCEPCHRLEHSGENHHYKFKEEKIKFNRERNIVSAQQRQKAVEVVNLLLNTDKTLKEISDDTGMSYTGVTRIYSGKRWKELYSICPKSLNPRAKAKSKTEKT